MLLRIEIVGWPELDTRLQRMENHMGAVAVALTEVTAKLDKAETEIKAKIASLLAAVAALEERLANAGLDEADKAALEAVKAEAIDLDGIVEDALPAEPETPVQPPADAA